MVFELSNTTSYHHKLGHKGALNSWTLCCSTNNFRNVLHKWSYFATFEMLFKINQL
jgi:hypothetical protein